MSDARFEDGAAPGGGRDAPLHLKAMDAEDLAVISSLVQDAVFPITEMRWRRGKRRFVVLVNRFRWEDRDAAETAGRGFERVRSVLAVEDVQLVSSQGIERREKDTVLAVLSVRFEPGHDGSGRVILTLAGDGAIALEVECLEVTLRDVERPYLAPSGRVPGHDD